MDALMVMLVLGAVCGAVQIAVDIVRERRNRKWVALHRRRMATDDWYRSRNS